MVRISKFSYENPRFRNLLSRGNSIPEGVEITVREVLRNVKERGDVALYEYMNEFDQVDMEKIGVLVTEEEFAMAREKVSEEFKESVRRACDNLFKFHKRQIPAGYSETYEDCAVLERKYTPTCGTARFSSGMSVQEFMRGYSVIQYPESALKKYADYIVELAESENMMAHALAVKVRC